METMTQGGLSMPTAGEVAFILLARQWNEEFSAIADDTTNIPESIDRLALSCLLLNVEWGHVFTGSVREVIEKNREAVAKAYRYLAWDTELTRRLSWDTELTWRLCNPSILMDLPSDTEEVMTLTANLNHQYTSVRFWMLDIGWIVRPWLDTEETVPILLKNLADALARSRMSAGLAAALTPTIDEFWSLAREFSPPKGFEDQYRDQLKYVEEYSIQEMQAPFWELEAQCRKIISQAVLGRKLPFSVKKK